MIKYIVRCAGAVAALLIAAAPLVAGPIEFGRKDLSLALEQRRVPDASVRLDVRIVPGGAECYRVTPRAVMASDERGAMYGLLQAAEDIRRTGRIGESHGCPAVAMRGIRYFLHNQALEARWYYSKEYWDSYFALLARNRFNRFNLVFAHQTNYLAPPYPFLIDVPEFPGIRVPGLAPADRDRNLETLQYISQAAADHGIDFTLGIWEHNVPTFPHPFVPLVEGITRENVGPYSHAALTKLLRLCPAIRSVQMRTNLESGITDDMRLAFYRDFVYTAIRDAGRPVYLDLRAWAVAREMIDAAEEVGVPLRVSSKYWAEHLGRPYQPAETYPGYSYIDLLRMPRHFQFYWELWGLGSHRLLLWGSPDYVRRAVSTFSLANTSGFEIDPPLAQKGYGNRPGNWGVLTAAAQNRVWWKWEFERYWMFYLLWGRLSYAPETADAVWLDELKHRFGEAASDTLDAYRASSGVINEIVAAHLPDPNMYIWPELSPGGSLDSYRDTLPSDWRYIASIPEALQNHLTHTASAKQTPRQTAVLLDGLAADVDAAVARVDRHIDAVNAEWRTSRIDFLVLAHLARYHARKQLAVADVAYFDATGDRSVLDSARHGLEEALRVWEALVALTDGVYPDAMAFGPEDVGHWKDKLPYVRHDLVLLDQRAAIADRFGRFDYAFDFGAAVKAPAPATAPGAFRENVSVLGNNVAPRFTAVDADTAYDVRRGYGWLASGARTVHPLPLTPYAIVRNVDGYPSATGDVLYDDFVSGVGAQVFRINAPRGTYKIHVLHPDRTDTVSDAASSGDVLDIALPSGDWSMSGIVVQGPASRRALPAPTAPLTSPRPRIGHHPPGAADQGRPISLRIHVTPADRANSIRLHYRGLNQKEAFKTIQQPAGRKVSFVIPGKDVSAEWGLMYYFEILDRAEGGWFYPDPRQATPYYVIDIRPGRRTSAATVGEQTGSHPFAVKGHV
jgi:hypothetical protein